MEGIFEESRILIRLLLREVRHLASEEKNDRGVVKPEQEHHQGAQGAVQDGETAEIEDIPSEEMLRRLPQNARKESGEESGSEPDFPVGDDLIDQEEHPVREQKGKEVFHQPLKNWSDMKGQAVSFDIGDE